MKRHCSVVLSARLFASSDGSHCQTRSLQEPWEAQNWTWCWDQGSLNLLIYSITFSSTPFWSPVSIVSWPSYILSTTRCLDSIWNPRSSVIFSLSLGWTATSTTQQPGDGTYPRVSSTDRNWSEESGIGGWSSCAGHLWWCWKRCNRASIS